MARPKKEIDWEVVEKLMECGCNGVEIAGKFRIQKQTFYLRFEEEYGISFQNYHTAPQEAGLADLKSMIHLKALNNKAPGNSNLLIFLARCRLGMKEPEGSTVAPNQSNIDQTHTIMRLQHQLAELEHSLAEDKSKNEQ